MWTVFYCATVYIGSYTYSLCILYTLCTQDLENYILELIPTLPQLNCLEESFYSFYVCTAVRKFFFFLDPMRTGVPVPPPSPLLSNSLCRIWPKFHTPS